MSQEHETSSGTKRVSKRQLESLIKRLSERDIAALAVIRTFRLIQAADVQTMLFELPSETSSARVCRRTLKRLSDAGLVRRLERRIGGSRAGSASYVYAATPLGHRLLSSVETHLPSGVAASQGARKRWKEPSLYFLKHTLAVAALAAQLVGESGRPGGAEIVDLQVEPDSWREFAGAVACARTLKPDLFVQLLSGEDETAWFVELDLATESGAAVTRKLDIYSAHYRSGTDQKNLGYYPRVLWHTTTEARAEQLRRLFATSDLPAGVMHASTDPDQTIDLLVGQSPDRPPP